MPAHTVFQIKLDILSMLEDYLRDYHIPVLTSNDFVHSYLKKNMLAKAVYVMDQSLLVFRNKRYTATLNKELEHYQMSSVKSPSRVGKSKGRLGKRNINHAELEVLKTENKKLNASNINLENELKNTNCQNKLYKKQVQLYFNLVSNHKLLFDEHIQKKSYGCIFLGLDPNHCSSRDITEARNKLALLWHPDRSHPLFKENNNCIMQMINSAYELASKKHPVPD